MSGITDIGAKAAEESTTTDTSDSDDYESDYERYDLETASFGLQHPPTAVTGTAIALRKLWDDDDPDRADVAVMMEDPSIVTEDEGLESSRVVNSEEEGDDFKVVNLADEQTAALGPGGKIEDPSDIDDEDDLMGIDFAGNTFYGDVGTAFDADDEIALKRGGGAGRSITSVLDVKGATAASTVEDEDGDPVLHGGGFPQHNGGLVEYHPDGRDGERPRYARDPELRPDVEGNEIVVMIQRLSEVDPDYDGPAYWATVFANLDEDRTDELTEQYADGAEDRDPEDFIVELTISDGSSDSRSVEFVRLKPTDEFEPDEDLLRDTGYISWRRPDIETLNEAREAEGFDPYEPAE